MKFIITSLAALFFVNGLFAETEKRRADYYVKNTTTDPKLTSSQSKFIFELDGSFKNVTLQASVNGVARSAITNGKAQFEFKMTPGKYRFQFFLSEEYYEITTDSIPVAGKEVKTIVLNFYESQRYEIEEKPVIYVYAKESTPLSVSIVPKGELTFTYPQTQGTWTGTATGTGFEINGTTYPYLFWEGKQQGLADKADWSKSCVVSSKASTAFLEQSCDRMGFNATEKTDFITYWGPRMMKYENVEILFLTENMDKMIGELTVSDNRFEVFRVFMLFREATDIDTRLRNVELPKAHRSEYFMLEWGGTEVENQNNSFVSVD